MCVEMREDGGDHGVHDNIGSDDHEEQKEGDRQPSATLVVCLTTWDVSLASLHNIGPRLCGSDCIQEDDCVIQVREVGIPVHAVHLVMVRGSA